MTIIISEILFEPTFECNLRCKYCYLGNARKQRRTTDWSYVTDAARRLTDKFLAEDYRVRNVLYHGAEVTVLPPEVLADVCNIFDEIAPDDYGFQAIQTNGTLITPEYIETFESRLHDGIRLHYSISVDSPEKFNDTMRGRGTYEKAMANARNLLKKGYPVHLFGCFTPEMFAHLDDMKSWIQARQAEGFIWKFQIASAPFNLSDEQQVKLAYWLDENDWIRRFNTLVPEMCGNFGNECDVNHFCADGLYPPCDRQTGEIVPLWLDKPVSRLLEMRQGAFAGTPTSPQCQYCPVRPVCHSGCPKFRVDGRAVDCMLKKTIYRIRANKLGIPMHKAIKLYQGTSNFNPPNDGIPTIAEIRRKGA
ncbi:radical SAM protein [Oxalobacter paraformigenes]|uniref:Radical SAM additional 4Fe4S-binding domain-containing protein n=1 Tax=Oxalobacter paraformigenes TaxID=556268 RepID=C3X344_9BURK|nr:radical SAM protein [Oxalobacter paraformigenes]EEO27630.1 radical SAM additional 4Fe4S-binding domain-containing protein [Oxalobacter paraformigenes]